ncbi:MAG TPA: hypothetical protein VGN51_17140 [Acidimicrobiia bacterium]|jgi:hypothetical protein
MVDGVEEEQHDPIVGRDSMTRRKLVFGLALVLIRRSPSGTDDGDMLG